jgi:hypothetical protein
MVRSGGRRSKSGWKNSSSLDKNTTIFSTSFFIAGTIFLVVSLIILPDMIGGVNYDIYLFGSIFITVIAYALGFMVIFVYLFRVDVE